MERDERDKFLDYVNTVRETPSKLARRPLMRYAPISWPARDVAALDRVLAIGGVPEDDASKRRAVLSTLRQLANTRGVLKLEREARRRARLAASFDEMLERTPKIGTPSFEIVSEGAFQVRRYEDFSVVRTARQQLARRRADGRARPPGSRSWESDRQVSAMAVAQARRRRRGVENAID